MAAACRLYSEARYTLGTVEMCTCCACCLTQLPTGLCVAVIVHFVGEQLVHGSI